MLPIIVNFGGEEEMTGTSRYSNPKHRTGRYTNKGQNPRRCIVTINLPWAYLDFLDKQKEWGLTPSRCEYIRTAVKRAMEIDIAFMESVDRLNECETLEEVRIPDYLERNGIKVLREA